MSSAFPSFLFDNHMCMRTGDKAELIHHLLKLDTSSITLDIADMGLQFVITGEGLLHRFSWPKHSSYADICAMYTRHVLGSFVHALVVFDKYNGSSTKDEAHRRRK